MSHTDKLNADLDTEMRQILLERLVVVALDVVNGGHQNTCLTVYDSKGECTCGHDDLVAILMALEAF